MNAMHQLVCLLDCVNHLKNANFDISICRQEINIKSLDIRQKYAKMYHQDKDQGNLS